MFGSAKTHVLCGILLMLASCLHAQDRSVGLFSSPKGLAIAFEIPSRASVSESDIIILGTDIYGLTFGRSTEPGYRLNYTHSYILDSFERNGSRFSLFAGPGVSAGYVHDFEHSIIGDSQHALKQSIGAMAALSGTFGYSVHFSRHVQIDLSLTSELGIHIRRDENIANMKLRLYKNGLVRTIYPQITIFACF